MAKTDGFMTSVNSMQINKKFKNNHHILKKQLSNNYARTNLSSPTHENNNTRSNSAINISIPAIKITKTKLELLSSKAKD